MSIQISMNDKEIISFINKVKTSISKQIVPYGLDKPLHSAVEELKHRLLHIINTEIRFVQKVKDIDTLKDDTLNVPQSDKDWVNNLLGINLADINKSTDYTKLFNQNVLVINNYRLRLQIPEDNSGGMEQSYQKALQFFRDAVVINIVNGQVRYYLVNNFNPEPHVKIVCSRDAGITDKSRRRYDNEKSSKAERFEKGTIGQYSTWSLRQDGVKDLIKDSVDITPIIESLKEGNFEKARSFIEGANKNNSSKRMQEIDDKIDNIQKRSDISPNTESYLEIIKLINTIKLLKKIEKQQTSYNLVADVGNAKVLSTTEIFEIIQKEASLWIITNQTTWVAHIVKLIENTIQGLISTKG